MIGEKLFCEVVIDGDFGYRFCIERIEVHQCRFDQLPICQRLQLLRRHLLLSFAFQFHLVLKLIDPKLKLLDGLVGVVSLGRIVLKHALNQLLKLRAGFDFGPLRCLNDNISTLDAEIYSLLSVALVRDASGQHLIEHDTE